MDKFMKIDKDFLPIYEFNKTFDEKVRKEGADLFAFSVERNDGYSECFSIDVLKEGVDDALNFRRAERFIKTALWTVGGYKLKIIANDTLYKSLENAYSHGGKRDFDVKFLKRFTTRRFRSKEFRHFSKASGNSLRRTKTNAAQESDLTPAAAILRFPR